MLTRLWRFSLPPLALLAALLLYCLPGVSYAAQPHVTIQSRPPQAVMNFYEDIEHHEYHEAYTYVAPGARLVLYPHSRPFTYALLVQRASQRDICGYSIAGTPGPNMVTMTIMECNTGPYHSHFVLKLVKGRWRIGELDIV